jgi:hypothetical protein
MLNEVKHLALVKRDSSASPQNDTHHLMYDKRLSFCILICGFDFCTLNFDFPLLIAKRPFFTYN